MPVNQTAKQKVTLYISDDLHRQFKIRSAIDGETMSSMAQRAIEFYLEHADIVADAGEARGQTHQIHACPKCASPVVLREDGLALIYDHSEKSFEGLSDLARVPELSSDSKRPGEGELITC